LRRRTIEDREIVTAYAVTRRLRAGIERVPRAAVAAAAWSAAPKRATFALAVPRRKRGSKRKASARREVALAKVKDDLSKYLRLAVRQEVVITRHGRPAGVLIGFDSEEDWLDYRLEHHREFLDRIAEARDASRKGLGIFLEEL
jgi:prevent-host-death family protein